MFWIYWKRHWIYFRALLVLINYKIFANSALKDSDSDRPLAFRSKLIPQEVSNPVEKYTASISTINVQRNPNKRLFKQGIIFTCYLTIILHLLCFIFGTFVTSSCSPSLTSALETRKDTLISIDTVFWYLQSIFINFIIELYKVTWLKHSVRFEGEE